MKKRIAIINQRYGLEVNGGSEYYTRELAGHLKDIYDVEVITTTARDYDTWKPYYSEGISKENGITVRRFSVKKQRNKTIFKLINKAVRMAPWFWKILEPIWLREQGPYCPDLIRYVKTNKDNFKAMIFVTYLYYTTVAGLPGAREKAILVPTAHNEYCIYFHMYKRIFTVPRGIIYLTHEEKKFVESLYHNNNILNVVAGAGIEVKITGDLNCFKNKYKLTGEYLIYTGRVDTSKKCDELIFNFIRFKDKHPGELKLLIVGKIMMNILKNKDIVYTGFIDEEEKNLALYGARALIMPSEHESLSLSVLEALAIGTPVLVNGRCQVLKKHCDKSKAGIYYENEKGFENGLSRLLDDEGYEKMVQDGKQYIRNNYNWNQTISKYRNMIEKLGRTETW